MAHPAAPSTAHHAPEAPAHEEHHNSFMPLWLTLGTTIFLVGLVLSGDARLFVSGVGFLVMAGSVIGWVREDVKELTHKPFQVHGSDYLYGTIVLILSEVVIFGILFTYYFWSRSHTTDFVPDAIREMSMTPIIVNTVVLLSSGVTVELAKWRMKRDDMKGFRIWLGITILLGAAFVYGQVNEYVHLMHEGLTAPGSVYGTSFYSLTGVHGLHVVAGVVALATIFGLSLTGFIRKERLSGMEGAFIYWHFVDAIWIVVFSVVYLRVI